MEYKGIRHRFTAQSTLETIWLHLLPQVEIDLAIILKCVLAISNFLNYDPCSTLQCKYLFVTINSTG